MSVSRPARAILVDAFAEAIRRATVGGKPVLATVSLAVTTPPSVAMFARWHEMHTDAFYWQATDPVLTLCGHGRAATLHADGDARFAELDRQWKTLLTGAVVVGERSPLAVGGCRFDSDEPCASHWHGFACADLPLPAVVLSSDGRSHHVLIQRLLDRDADAWDEAGRCTVWLDEIDASPIATRPLPVALNAIELPAELWQSKVDDALAAIEAGRLSKVVLARETCQCHAGNVPVETLLHHLSLRAGNAHVFAFARGDACFLGATPERLLSVSSGQLQTHALAGSVARDADDTRDQALARQLLASAKDRMEHELVVRAIVQSLDPFVESLDAPSIPEIKRLPRIQHLCTPMRGTLHDDVSPLDLLAALHPTPAVAGLPRPEALDHIREHEGFDRGWYAAPVGWLNASGDGDFLVALRSALVRGDRCHMYAGCGIVEGSDPRAEYLETCLKLAQMREALVPPSAASP